VEVLKETGKPVAASMCIGPEGDMHGVSPAECAVRLAKAGGSSVCFRAQRVVGYQNAISIKRESTKCERPDRFNPNHTSLFHLFTPMIMFPLQVPRLLASTATLTP